MSGWAAAGAAVGAGIGQLGSTWLNNVFSLRNSKKQYKYNRWAWLEANEYNKPINQMARLKEAGLNPNLVYGTGASTLASQQASTSAPQRFPYQMDLMTALNAYQDLRQKDATTANLEAQSDNIRVQNALLRQQERSAAAEADIREHNYNVVKGTKLFVGETGPVSTAYRVGDAVNSAGVVDRASDFLERFVPGRTGADYYYNYYRRRGGRK